MTIFKPEIDIPYAFWGFIDEIKGSPEVCRTLLADMDRETILKHFSTFVDVRAEAADLLAQEQLLPDSSEDTLDDIGDALIVAGKGPFLDFFSSKSTLTNGVEEMPTLVHVFDEVYFDRFGVSPFEEIEQNRRAKSVTEAIEVVRGEEEKRGHCGSVEKLVEPKNQNVVSECHEVQFAATAPVSSAVAERSLTSIDHGHYGFDLSAFPIREGAKSPDFVPDKTDLKKEELPHSELEGVMVPGSNNRSVDALRRMSAHAGLRQAARKRKQAAIARGAENAVKKNNKLMVDASELLGETASDAWMKVARPNSKRLRSELPGDGKTGEFDRVYVDGKDVFILEAKGAGVQRGSRDTRVGRAEQGTPEYRDSVIHNMEKTIYAAINSNKYATKKSFKKQVDELAVTFKTLTKARDNNRLKYFQISQRVKEDGSVNR